MARVNRMSVQKRLRERKKAEKAELKREMRLRKDPDEPEEVRETGDQVATRDDLAGYGLVVEEDEEA
jgi:hypothetical protein